MVHRDDRNDISAKRRASAGSRWAPLSYLLGRLINPWWWPLMFVGIVAVGRGASVDTEPPSIPGRLVATAVTAAEITLSWSASTDNVQVFSYEVFDGDQRVAALADRTKTFAKLTPESRHRFAVRARDIRANWSALSSVLEVSTSPDRSPPSAPTGLTIESEKFKSFVLRWNVPADDVGVAEYEIFKDGVLFGRKQTPVMTIGGLEPATSYEMSVSARDAAGNWSPRSATIRASTLKDTTAPSIPTGLFVSALTPSKLTLKWDAAHDDLKVTVYQVLVDGVGVGSTATNYFNLAGLAPATRHRLTVRAADAAANWSGESAACDVSTLPDTVQPSTPAGLVAENLGPTGLTLGWSAAADNVGVTGYEVFRGEISLGLVATRVLAVTGLAADTPYTFKVRACDASANWSNFSALLKIRTTKRTEELEVPSGLRASEVTGTTFNLSWSPVTKPAAPIYEVFQNGISLGTTSQPSWSVTGLFPGARYGMTVRSGDGTGRWSGLSEELAVVFRGVPFLAGFEAEEGYVAGPLDRQNGWQVSGSTVVISSSAQRGHQAISVPAAARASIANRGFAESAPAVIFIDVFAIPGAGANPVDGVFLETESAVLSLVRNGAQGELQVYSGDGHGQGRWITVEQNLPLDDAGKPTGWRRFTLRCDYRAKRWDLYDQGRLIAADLGFVADDATSLAILSLSGNALASSEFDEVLVSFDNPIFPDVDRDGMDDQWEQSHGLDPALDDRHDDHDGNGITNLGEYLAYARATSSGDHDGGADENPPDDPSTADEDHDHLPDAWEILHGLDPRNAADAGQDGDGDGRSNAEEFTAGTNPNDFYNGRALFIAAGMRSATIAYQYDASGRLISAKYPNAREIRYERDEAGNLLRVSAAGGRSIVDWRARYDLPTDGGGDGADDRDLAHDGIPNLAKYAFGLDPRVAVSAELPAVRLSKVVGAQYLTLEYERPEPAPTDLTYTVQVSTNGTTWSDGTDVNIQIDAGGAYGMAKITARDSAPVVAPRFGRWIRLKIERK
ncbi:MAG: hypothetical protein JWM32_538 [Verrucomicrobia bacterium]|nr:hypothetical protein [Verrucomicrobiota bacterium]